MGSEWPIYGGKSATTGAMPAPSALDTAPRDGRPRVTCRAFPTVRGARHPPRGQGRPAFPSGGTYGPDPHLSRD